MGSSGSRPANETYLSKVVKRIEEYEKEVGADHPTVEGLPEQVPRSDDGLPHSWSEGEATDYKVRGDNYLKDSVKFPSLISSMELADVDIFQSSTKGFFGEHPKSYVERARAIGDKRFFFVVHLDCCPDHLVCTFTPRVPFDKNIPDSVYTCWERFLEGDDKYRSKRFKILPFALDGSWIVRKTIGSRPIPAIIGRKLKCKWLKRKGFVEFYCDVLSSYAASTIVSVSKGGAAGLVLDLGFMVEGQETDELPEQLIGVARLNHIDMSRIRKL